MCGDGCLKIISGETNSTAEQKPGGDMCPCNGVDDGFCDGVDGMATVSPEMAKKIFHARQSDKDAGIDQVPVTDEVAKLVEEGRWRPTPH